MKSKLVTLFSALSINEQNILLVLAVIYAPIGQSNLQRLLRTTGLFEAKIIATIDKPLREKLQKAKLIIITSDGWRCNEEIAELLMRHAIKEPWFTKLAQLLIAEPNYYYPASVSIYHAIKQLRIFLYQGNDSAFAANIERLHIEYPQKFADNINRIFFNDYDAEWFTSLSDQIKFLALRYFLHDGRARLNDVSKYSQLLEHFFGTTKPEHSAIVHTVIEERIFHGDFKDAESWLAGDSSVDGLKLLATLRFLQNRNNEAIELFNAALKALKKETGKRNVGFVDMHGYIFNLALLRSRNPGNLQLLKQQTFLSIKQGWQNEFYLLNLILLEVVDIYQGKSTAEHSEYLFKTNNFAYERLFHALLLYWVGEIEIMTSNPQNKVFLSGLAEFCQQAQQLGYVWYAAVSSSLLQRLDYKNKSCRLIAEQYLQSPFTDIIDLLPQVSAWQRALDALTQLTAEPSASVQKQSRLSWLLNLDNNIVTMAPKEQVFGKSGRWTKGKPVSLKRLYHDMADFDYLSEQDRRICAHIELEKEPAYYGYSSKEYYVLPSKAIIEASGHPHVYWLHQEALNIPVDISLAEPQLLVKEQKENLYISLIPQITTHQVITQKTASNGLIVYVINDSHRQVAEILGKNGLTVPATARQQVIDSIASIASMLTVQSDIGGTSSHALGVEADSRLHIHLQPVGQGIQIELFAQPFSNGGPLYKPGVGGTTVLAEIDGKQLQTTRDFKLENRYLKQILSECPELYAVKELKWLLDDAESALEALLQLQTLGDFAVLEWPKGKKIQLSREAGLAQVQFSVRKEKDWFSVEGSVQVDAEQVLDMQRLMSLLSSSSGRFLKLEDGQIIVLTRELRQRLDDLAGLGEVQKDKVRFHPLAALALDEITNGMAVTASKPWKDQLLRLNEMGDLNPALPSTLQGELRDYQREGFQWMMRLAHWGAGACLADDMGLGKTVQALALILARASKGPTLILAPTSVCINWLEEAQRFAPTLNIYQFGLGGRQDMLDAAGPFDLIVCSYGLLQTEADRLTQKHWHTIVADEAQAIKNATTKRSKAAMALQADFKLITTGTPIENHLGELWNLFNFINPGLLGSLQKFNERYAQAIENERDHEVQQRLRKLLRPFILRRLKNDVLTELPSRTEVTLHVELSPGERTFYEALRRNAMQTMMEDTTQPGHKQLKILAEIMKLRRACCHPRLVMEESTLGSSKLEAFEELVDELLDNRHKALVFSQFVGHLTLIRELLDKKGIPYHYLDGSTPVPQRKKAVNLFQAGDGDLFLISLKAGGTGLNLTAADYVIHMDPWWNPAVEDQASDRAHRMGQKRPVTIYRLVAKDTIEDKIVDLHKHKRDLANSLLEGGEVSGKMSVEDMMALIKDID
ncbi:DEAD/DEAH box helicase [Methylobacter sp. S3L5C]|uniref:DEAD/DEAH box helicase n=1 Tax=Methylobacter sp. S3L5C TaxID=2839024 RepID=UPI001FAD5A17|nr:DEAD/DEAH box helicase [Methylobacter sp. S3L5C]UOA08740.1 DEAD/DEAH box helicase [Methylobacter sp. S3L5C]